MAIQIVFDSSHNVIPPTLVLTTRNGDRLGGLLYHNLVVKQAIRQSMEMSFSVNRADYCEKNHNADLWNLIADFKLVWCKEWNCYFEINVTTNEEYTTDKEITAVSLGDAELSQINLYNIQINTEDDIAREDYESTVLYDEDNPNASLLHRIMEKVPHYIVKYVDPAVASIQRTFTFDNKSLYDALQEIAEEMECVFDIECRHTINGIERSISVFDLENYGNDTNILLSTDALADNINYSIDTGAVKNCFRLEGGDDLMTATIRNCNPNGSGYIWYISNELKSDMSDELVEQLEKYNEQYDYFYKYYNPFDTEIKNYTGKMLVGRLLEDYGYGGNVDLLHRPLVPITNIANAGWNVDTSKTIETLHIITYPNSDGTVVGNFTPILTNSSGSYVRTLSPTEMEQYAAGVLNGETDDSETSKLQIGSLFYGDSAVQKAAEASDRITELQEYYYDDDNSDEFVDPEIVTEFDSSIADKTDIINSYNTLVRKYQTYTDDYKEIKTPINGYPAIMEAYYNTIDFYYYLNDSLMPTSQMSDTNAQAEANKLHYQSLKNTAIQNLSSTTSVATVNSAIAAMAKAIVDTRYQIKVLDDDCSFNFSTTEGRSSTWNGKIKVTNYSDEEDTYTAELRSIPISSDYATFIQQKLNTVLANTRTDTVADISDIFKMDNSHFKAELKRYSLKRLEAFHDACQGCIDVLIQQGIADNSNTESDMYQQIYLPYYNKLGFIQSEIDVRQGELDIVAGKFDSEGGLLADGIQTILEKERNAIQSNLDFQDYLGSTLWQEFVAYRREDTYSNTNYVSDGLGNDELFARAMEFIQTAKDEIEKSATKQHTINARLKNLLVMKEFASIVNCFEVGNWLRLKVDGRLFKLRLVDYQIDFENLESIDITFSDIVVDGTEATAKDILNQAASMATSYNTVSRQARKGDKTSSVVDNFVNDGLALTTTKIIDTADNQEVSWDKHGLVCREYDSLTDSYSDTQVKLINKGVYVTDNKWRTAKAGIGNFTFFNPAANNGEGEYQEAYGVIADTLVGNLILGKSVGIYNTKNSITMDENGFTLTTDGTGSDDPQSVFTIRRKTVNNGVKSFKDMFYIDSNGFVTINGGVKIDIDGESGTSTMVEMVDGKITTHIAEELEDGGLIQSSISQTAGEIRSEVEDTAEGLSSSISQTASVIKSTVSSAMNKYSLDEFNFTVSLFGFGAPDSDLYPPSDYAGAYYLDQNTGEIYYCFSSHGSWVKSVYTAPLITDELNSKIIQTEKEIKSTVAEVTSKYDETGHDISVRGYGDPNPSDILPANYENELYLDQNSGAVWESDGELWTRLKDGENNDVILPLITTTLASSIQQTATGILTTVSQTYETKEDSSTKKTALESSIEQTASNIASTVKATSGWDISSLNYTIDIIGVTKGILVSGQEYYTISGYDAGADRYKDKYYLDDLTGRVYKSEKVNGVYRWLYITSLSRADSSIYSRIDQTANQIKGTVSSAVSKWDLSSLTHSIDLYGYGHPQTDSELNPYAYPNKYYLDQTNGYVYYAYNGTWSRTEDELSLITSNLSSSITQTASNILSTVSSTYETKEDSDNKKSALESSIDQTASNIESTVKATSGWDISSLDYTISIIGTSDRGDDHSVIDGYAAEDYVGKFYLDDLTGHVYESKLESGSTTEYAWWWKANLTRASSSIYSRIDQTATQIKSTVAQAVSKYDESGYTINVKDYGSPDDTIYPHVNYVNKLYLDQETGYVYKASSSGWSNHKDSNNENIRLPLITDKLSASITVKAGEILSTVEDTYETTENASKRQTELQSSIGQTASNIASTVKATSGWDIVSLSYTVNLIGTAAGTQVSGQSYYTISGYDASSYKNMYYLDDLNGKVYHSESVSGTYRWVLKATLTRASSSIYSRIDQTANSITSTVAQSTSKYDETGYTISLYGFGQPTETANANILYLDQKTGNVYKSSGSSWSVHKDSNNDNVVLPLITSNLQSQIVQNASDITLKVSEGELGTKIQQNPNAVKIAWNKNSQYIAFEGAALNIYNSSTQNSTTLLMKLNNTGLGLYESVSDSDSRLKMKLNSGGATYYCEGTNIGTIGAGNWDTMKGLTFHLEHDAQYMAWSWKETANANAYTVKFYYRPLRVYVAGSNTTYEKGFYFEDDVTFDNDIKLNGNTLYLNSSSSSYIGFDNNNTLNIVGATDKALTLTGYGGKSLSIGGGGVTINTDLSVTGTVTSGSDARLKTRIAESKINALSLLSDIEVKEFDWVSDTSHTSAGIIAQQLEEVIPELVCENSETGLLSIKVDRFIPFIVKAIQELYVFCGGKKQKNKSKWVDSLSEKDKRVFTSSLLSSNPKPSSKSKKTKEKIMIN